MTIRLPKPLKDLIDKVADERGVSLNSWYVRTLARGVAHQMRGVRGEAPGVSPFEGRGGRRGRGRFGGRRGEGDRD